MLITHQKSCSSLLKRLLLLNLTLCLPSLPVFAASDSMVTFTPISSQTVSIFNNGGAVLVFGVTNNGNSSLNLDITMNMPGALPLDDALLPTGPGSCLNQQSLAPGASCTARALITGQVLTAFQGNGTSITNLTPTASANTFWTFQGSPFNIGLPGTDAPATLSGKGLALSVKDTGLNAALTGTSREMKIMNTGSSTANSVDYLISPALPSDASITPASCGDIPVIFENACFFNLRGSCFAV